jgi:predicted glycosyltransferase
LAKNTRLEKKNLRILVCPLDWGMGHATRCVPVIKFLLRENHRVIIAADGRPLEFLRDYFPQLEYRRLPGFRISYPSGKDMALKMAFQAPSILFNIYREHRRIKEMVSECNADVVISDNRFGLWSKNVKSVYITHQVMIKAPSGMKWAEPLLYRIHGWFISHYDACWIPDLPGPVNLSGDLSHLYPIPRNGRYAGLLSRFEPGEVKAQNNHYPESPDLLVLISGPEPQRTKFESAIVNDLKDVQGIQTVVLRGLPGEQHEMINDTGNYIYNHLPDADIRRLILTSKVILCRPGYSTIMDLATLGRNAVLVPTPGQTEQEYLAIHLSRNGTFRTINQDELTLSRVLDAGDQLPQKFNFPNDTIYDRIPTFGNSFSPDI